MHPSSSAMHLCVYTESYVLKTQLFRKGILPSVLLHNLGIVELPVVSKKTKNWSQLNKKTSIFSEESLWEHVMCANNRQDHHYRVLAFHTEYHRLYIGQDTNILNDNTGSDAFCHVIWLQFPHPPPFPLTPSLSEYQKHRPCFKLRREECLEGGGGSLGTHKLGFFGWEGKEDRDSLPQCRICMNTRKRTNGFFSYTKL